MEASSICYNSFIELWLTHPGSRSVKCRGRWFLAHSGLCIHRDCQAPWRRRHPERHPQLRASPPARARLCSRLSAVLSGRFQQAERTRVALCIRCSRRARRSRLVRTAGGSAAASGCPCLPAAALPAAAVSRASAVPLFPHPLPVSWSAFHGAEGRAPLCGRLVASAQAGFLPTTSLSWPSSSLLRESPRFRLNECTLFRGTLSFCCYCNGVFLYHSGL